MAKIKVAETEVRKQPPFSRHNDYMDLGLFRKFINGSSIDDICREYCISRGQAQLRIKDVILKLPERLKIQIPDKRIVDNYENYRPWWKNLLETYEIGQQLYNYNSIFSLFINYFKKQSRERQKIIL